MGKISRALEKAEARRTGAGSGPAEEKNTTTPRRTPRETAAARGKPRAIERVLDAYGTPDEHMVCVHESGGRIASQFRSLRTKLMTTAAKGAETRVIAITSGTRGEGKTTVAANLSVALAEMDGTRALVIDTDFYRPMIHERFAVTPERVLNNVLTEGLDLDGALYATAVPNLDILPAAASERSGLETSLERMSGPMLKELARHYDYIVVDTPPIISASHGAVIGRWADGLLLIARAERTPRQVVKRAQDELEKAGVNIIGCVLTHVKYHIPDLLYRLLGTPSKKYYDYYKPDHLLKKR